MPPTSVPKMNEIVHADPEQSRPPMHSNGPYVKRYAGNDYQRSLLLLLLNSSTLGVIGVALGAGEGARLEGLTGESLDRRKKKVEKKFFFEKNSKSPKKNRSPKLFCTRFKTPRVTRKNLVQTIFSKISMENT